MFQLPRLVCVGFCSYKTLGEFNTRPGTVISFGVMLRLKASFDLVSNSAVNMRENVIKRTYEGRVVVGQHLRS